jgi:hypothetical protein
MAKFDPPAFAKAKARFSFSKNHYCDRDPLHQQQFLAQLLQQPLLYIMSLKQNNNKTMNNHIRDMNTLIVSTRNSKLALIQANYIANLLSAPYPGLEFPLRSIIVRGYADKITSFLLITDKIGNPNAVKNL